MFSPSPPFRSLAQYKKPPTLFSARQEFPLHTVKLHSNLSRRLR